jgi:hypothetical protein
LVIRMGLGADEADVEDTAPDECSGNISPSGRASLCDSSRRSAKRSRRQAILTVSMCPSTHFTEAELDEEMRDFAVVGLREEVADTVDDERPHESKGEVLLNPVEV